MSASINKNLQHQQKSAAASALGQERDSATLVAPFTVTADTLHSLFTPYKNPSLARSLGGGHGICLSLCVNPDCGLADASNAFVPGAKDAAVTNAIEKINADTKVDAPATANDNQPLVSSSKSGVASSTSVCVAAALENAVDLELRRRVFGENKMPPAKLKSLWQIILEGMQDRMLQLLSIAAILTTIFGIVEVVIESSSGEHSDAPSWAEGISIIVTVLFVISVGSLTEWKKVQTFAELNKAKDDITFTVLRDSRPCTISTFDILVGDILLVQTGDIMPCDAVVLAASSLRCDESSATGESDLIRKSTDPEGDPLLLSGSKVVEGTATAVFTCVGPLSFYGSIMASLRREPRLTPLQEQLNTLANKIAILGMGAAILMLILRIVMVSIEVSADSATVTDRADFAIKTTVKYVRAFASAVSIIVVAVPEGLPVAVTSALCLAAYRMMRENNFVRELAACEVMANATTICSDKTGTLTQNRMAVVRACFGGILRKLASIEDANSLRRIVGNQPYYDVLIKTISVNSTAFADKDQKTGADIFVGSKTEVALLDLLRNAGTDVIATRNEASIVHSYPFSSEAKWMGTIVDMKSINGGKDEKANAIPSVTSPTGSAMKYRFYVKGASEIILRGCNSLYRLLGKAENGGSLPSPNKLETVDPTPPIATDSDNTSGVVPMTVDMRAALENTIEAYARASLRTIIVAYCDYDELPKDYETSGVSMLNNLTHLALFGIEDPLRPGVIDAVSTCNKAGVFVRMVTGDNINTARAIASQAGILRGGIAMEGRVFRRLSENERMNMLPRLQVLARSSPEDKQLLVKSLREMGEVVAVTGDGTNDAPALRMADVGFSMYLSGTKVAVDASSIALLDDNFSSIVTAILWGRNVNGAVKKFIQFQLSVNCSSVIIAFIAAFFNLKVMTVMQMLWINVIMDSGAAIAYVSERPSRNLLKQNPEPRDAPLISARMLRIIASTAVLQIALLVVLLCAFDSSSFYSFVADQSIFLSEYPTIQAKEYAENLGRNTFAFNAFVYLQIFSEINSRILDRRLNMFYGILKSPGFSIVLLITAALQTILICFGSSVFSVTRLTAEGYFSSAAVGVFPLFTGFLMRVIPETWFFCCPTPPPRRVAVTRERLQWQSAVNKVRTQLAVYRALRGDVVLERTGAHIIETAPSNAAIDETTEANRLGSSPQNV